MSIATAITAAQSRVANCYTAISNKGGTLPATQNLANMPTAIDSIPSGSTPTLITKSITENGTYDATSDNADGYSSVTVNVSGGGGSTKYGCTIDNLLGDIDANGKLQFPTAPSGDIVFNGVKDVDTNALSYKFYYNTNLTHGVSFPDLEKISGDYGCYYMFYSCSSLTSVSFPNLTTVSGYNGCYYMFCACSSLTSVSFPSLTTISGSYVFQYIFYSCSSLTSVSFPSLTTISGNYGCYYMFCDCKGLTSVSFPSLTTISGSYGCNSMFCRCSSLTSVSFPSLTTVSRGDVFYNSFVSCTNIEHIYFPALTTSSFGTYKNQFSNMMSSTGTTKTHTIHFPSNLESKISTLSGYPLFGGTSGYVTLSFDLPATS